MLHVRIQILLLKPPCEWYIKRHPTPLEHLIPKTPSPNAYLERTRTLASSLTHVWDLPSILTTPVQRLLKYSLFFTAMVDGAPDGHPDKPNLIKTKASMEEVAQGVNEGRRRREVIKEVLTGGKAAPDSSAPPLNGATLGLKPKKGLTVGVTASVKLRQVNVMKDAAKA